MPPMDEITGARRVPGGISIRVKKDGGQEEMTFPFKALIDQDINALHLLQAPHKYAFDPVRRAVMRKKERELTFSPPVFPGG